MDEANGRRVGGLSHRWALPAGLASCPRGETIVASDITLAVDDGARRLSGLCAALVIILGFAALPAQAGPAPREPYSCRLYVDAFGNCDA